MFKSLTIKPEYRSFHDDMVREFYIPILGKSKCYKRAVGFFSSSSLVEISNGITGLVKNGGKIQLVASPQLSEEDITAIEKGFDQKEKIIESALINNLTSPLNLFEEKRLNLLANLIAKGQLELKIATTEKNSNIGIFHEKMGLMYDSVENIIAFTGSMNESQTAFYHNYESIDVYTSWSHDKERVLSKEKAFTSIWDNNEPYVNVLEFPKVDKAIIERFKTEDIDLSIDEEEFIKVNKVIDLDENIESESKNDEIILYDYQNEAIDEWEKNGFVGIFDMATGTGKTFTGLGAVRRLKERLDGNLAMIFVCPYQHLVEQWVEDIERFGMKPIIGYSSSKQRNWKKRLSDAVRGFNLKVRDELTLITTNASFTSDFVQDQINKLKGNVVLVVDEAHNFGAAYLSKKLPKKISYRLALSATIERHGDEEGTEKLYSYFGKKCIEYTLKEAIDNDKLTPYFYHPIVVCLSNDELSEYKEITSQIFKHISSNDKNGKIKMSEYGKLLLIKRANIIASAREKIEKLREIIEDYKGDSHMLVYCGATTLKDVNYKEGQATTEEKRQIDIVTGMLGYELNMRVSKFTSEETAEERELIKKAFSDGKHLQTLVAIRCLDEGVNIPSIKTAFLLASSTNPKEYIQRRGRVLRKYDGKDSAVIYDFITLPASLEEIKGMTPDEIQSVQSLAQKEITRMKEFASIAENSSAADKLIQELNEVFDLNKIRGDEFERAF